MNPGSHRYEDRSYLLKVGGQHAGGRRWWLFAACVLVSPHERGEHRSYEPFGSHAPRPGCIFCGHAIALTLGKLMHGAFMLAGGV
jgi:hypothetical protein